MHNTTRHAARAKPGNHLVGTDAAADESRHASRLPPPPGRLRRRQPNQKHQQTGVRLWTDVPSVGSTGLAGAVRTEARPRITQQKATTPEVSQRTLDFLPIKFIGA